MCVEADLLDVLAAAPRTHEFDEGTAIALALTVWQHGYVVEQKARRRFLEHQDADDASRILSTQAWPSAIRCG